MRECNINSNELQDEQLYTLIRNSPQLSLEDVRPLLLGGANVNYHHFNRWTCCFYAVYHSNLELTKLLIESFGADTTMLTAEGYSLLHCAVMAGSYPITQYLITNHNMQLNLQSQDDGATPLIKSIIFHRWHDILPFLIHNGADINLPLHDGTTPLHLAAGGMGSYKLIRRLVENGANMKRINNKNQTAEEYAIYKSQPHYAKFIRLLQFEFMFSTFDSSTNCYYYHPQSTNYNNDDNDGVHHSTWKECFVMFISKIWR